MKKKEVLCFTSEQLFTLLLSHRLLPVKLTQNVDRSNKNYAKPGAALVLTTHTDVWLSFHAHTPPRPLVQQGSLL